MNHYERNYRQHTPVDNSFFVLVSLAYLVLIEKLEISSSIGEDQPSPGGAADGVAD